jgi:hypothetical protein
MLPPRAPPEAARRDGRARLGLAFGGDHGEARCAACRSELVVPGDEDVAPADGLESARQVNRVVPLERVPLGELAGSSDGRPAGIDRLQRREDRLERVDSGAVSAGQALEAARERERGASLRVGERARRRP